MRVAVVVALVLAPMLAGCLAPVPATVQVPYPERGPNYVYEGPGGRLNVTVEAVGPRYDGVFRVHPSLVLNVTVDPTEQARCHGPPVPVCYLGEAVDRADGLVIQHWNRCGAGPRNESSPWCTDPRAVVGFDGGGLPGGFGAGPLWGAELTSGKRTVELSPLSLDRTQLNYTAEPTASDRGPCLELSSSDGVDKTGLQTMTLAVLTGPLTVCDGLALPTSFTTVTGDAYELVDYLPGDEAVPASEDSAWDDPGDPFPRRPWDPPIVVSDLPDTSFPVAQAHETALEERAEYRSVIEDGGLVVATGLGLAFKEDTEVPGDTGNRRVWERKLSAVTPDGRGYTVTVEKDVRWGPNGQAVNNTSVLDGESFSWDQPPTQSSLPDRLAPVAPMAPVAERITGQPLSLRRADSTGGLGPTSQPEMRIDAGLSTDFGQDRIFRDTLTLTPWVWDPPPYDSPIIITTPYKFTVDAASGHLEHVDVNRTRLPLDQPPALPHAR